MLWARLQYIPSITNQILFKLLDFGLVEETDSVFSDEAILTEDFMLHIPKLRYENKNEMMLLSVVFSLALPIDNYFVFKLEQNGVPCYD